MSGGVVGMAVADFDHDGGLDIAVLYLRGRRQFATVLRSQGQGSPRSPSAEFEGLALTGDISAGDFDGDGWVDLVVSHGFDPFANPNPFVSVFWNEQGSFDTDHPQTFPVDYPDNPLLFVNGLPQVLPDTHADFDGDGVEDLVIPATCSFAFLTRNPTPTPAGREAHGIVRHPRRGRFDYQRDDGDIATLPPALVSAEWGDPLPWGCGYVMIVRGDRSRSLRERYRVPLGFFPQGGYVRDLDQDGVPDIALGGFVGLSLLYGRGNFEFEPHFYPRVSNFPAAQVVAGDVNNDGLLDLVLGQTEEVLVIPASGRRRYASRLGLMVVSGEDPFVYLSGGEATYHLCDLDRDGALDVIVADGADDVWSFFNRPAERTFVGPVVSHLRVPDWQAGKSTLVATDVDRDGYCDLVFQARVATTHANGFTTTRAWNLGVLFGSSQGSFVEREAVYGAIPQDKAGPGGIPLMPHSVIPIPLQHETALLMTARARFSLWRFGQDFSPQPAQTFLDELREGAGGWWRKQGPAYTKLWDIDGDGDEDIVVLFRRYESFQVATPPVATRVGVYLRDGDVFSITPLLSSTEWGTTATVGGEVARSVPIGFADVDEDGRLDVLWMLVPPRGEYIGWSRGLPDLRFSEPAPLGPALPSSVGAEKIPWRGIWVQDVTGDGRSDLVVTLPPLAVMEGLGDGRFGYATLYGLPQQDASRRCCANLVDLDLDGRPEALAFGDELGFDFPAAVVDQSGNLVQSRILDTVYILYNAVEPPPLFTPTPTPTPGVTPTWTPYKTVAPPPTPRCRGDCNLDGMVTIDELVVGVHFALNPYALESGIDLCGFDRDGNRLVTVDELVYVLGLLLAGCP
jgi:hypothetical protein